jgi:hypothetical protein
VPLEAPVEVHPFVGEDEAFLIGRIDFSLFFFNMVFYSKGLCHEINIFYRFTIHAPVESGILSI